MKLLGKILPCFSDGNREDSAASPKPFKQPQTLGNLPRARVDPRPTRAPVPSPNVHHSRPDAAVPGYARSPAVTPPLAPSDKPRHRSTPPAQRVGQSPQRPDHDGDPSWAAAPRQHQAHPGPAHAQIGRAELQRPHAPSDPHSLPPRPQAPSDLHSLPPKDAARIPNYATAEAVAAQSQADAYEADVQAVFSQPSHRRTGSHTKEPCQGSFSSTHAQQTPVHASPAPRRESPPAKHPFSVNGRAPGGSEPAAFEELQAGQAAPYARPTVQDRFPFADNVPRRTADSNRPSDGAGPYGATPGRDSSSGVEAAPRHAAQAASTGRQPEHMQRPSVGGGSDRATTADGVAPSSLDDIAAFVDNVLIGQLGGRFHRQYTIQQGSVRRLVHCVACTATSNLNRYVDVLFFAQEVYFKRQQDSCQKQQLQRLQKFRPPIRDAQPAGTYTDQQTSRTVELPAFIVSDITQSLDEVVLPENERQRRLVLNAIGRDLAEQLSVLHGAGFVHTQIKRSNVVCFSSTDGVRWTLLEFCAYIRKNRSSTTLARTLDVRYASPEAAETLRKRDVEGVIVTGHLDVWQMGVLIYEVFMNRPYWPPYLSDAEVLGCLVGSDPLPHTQAASELNDEIRQLLEAILCRNPANRIKMDDIDLHFKPSPGATRTYQPATLSVDEKSVIVLPAAPGR